VPTTTVFTPSLFPLPAPAVHHVSQSWWTCHCGASGRHRYRERFDTMLAPGLLLTVMPPTVTERFELEILPEPGWKGQIPSWFGIPCRLGRVTVCWGHGPYRVVSACRGSRPKWILCLRNTLNVYSPGFLPVLPCWYRFTAFRRFSGDGGVLKR